MCKLFSNLKSAGLYVQRRIELGTIRVLVTIAQRHPEPSKHVTLSCTTAILFHVELLGGFVALQCEWTCLGFRKHNRIFTHHCQVMQRLHRTLSLYHFLQPCNCTKRCIHQKWSGKKTSSPYVRSAVEDAVTPQMGAEC